VRSMVDDLAARYEYDAFISYNRKADGRLAAALHDALHRFAKPWYRLRARRVFRDDDSLGANPGLWPSLERALAASRFLVLLAGRGSANSVWVARELEYWCREREPDTLIVVATDPDHGDRLVWSEPDGDFDWSRTTALPRALRGLFPAEPRIVDLAWARERDTLSLDDPLFRAAVADIAAPISGRPKDELIGEDVRQHRRTMRWVRSAVAVLAGLLVLAVAAAAIAVRQRDVAQDRAAVAEARQYAAESLAAADPYAALGLAIAAEQRTPRPLPEARTAYATAVQRAATWTTRPIAQYASTNLQYRELSWAPDGSRLRAAGDDGSVLGWDLRTGAPLPTVPAVNPAFPPGLNSVAWYGQSTLAFESGTNRFTLRDLASPGRSRGPFRTAADIGGIAFSPDGRTLAISMPGGVELWDAARARRLVTLAGGPAPFTWRTAWSPDGTRLVVAGEPGMWFWDVPHRRLLSVAPSTSGLWSIAWHPSGSMFAIGADHGEVTIRDGRTGAVRDTLAIPAGNRVADLAWAPDGRRLAAAGGVDGVRLWTLRDGDLVPYGSPLRSGFDRGPRRLAWSPDGRMIAATVGFAGQPELDDLHVWAVAPLPPDDPAGLPGTVRLLDWGPDSRHLAAGALAVTVIDARTGDRWTVRPSAEAPTAVSWSPRGDGTIALAAEDGVRLARSTGTGVTVAEPLWNSGGSHALAWSPGGDRLAVGDTRGRIALWPASGGKRPSGTLTVPAGGEPPTATAGPTAAAADGYAPPDWLAWSADGGTVHGGLTDGRALGWHAATGRPVGEPWAAAPGGARAMAWTPDGTGLATVSRDGTLRVWSVADRRLRQTLSGIGGDATALDWSPDGTRLAAGGNDGRIRIWQASGGTLLAETTTGSAVITALDWSPDGTRIATGAATGGVTVYAAHPERESCARVRDAAGLTPMTREAAGRGLDVCRAGKVRDLPPLPVVAEGGQQ
jgi:WD40 repeat protein